MKKQKVKVSRPSDLIAAAVYGSIVALVLGMPSFSNIENNSTAKLAVEKTGNIELNGINWSQWTVSGGDTLLCPPGQSAFVLQAEGEDAQVICGYEGQGQSGACSEKGQVEYHCRADAEVENFYLSVGYNKPEEFAGCCPAGSKAICQYADDRIRLRSHMHCRL